MHMYVYTYIYIYRPILYIYIYTYMYMCVYSIGLLHCALVGTGTPAERLRGLVALPRRPIHVFQKWAERHNVDRETGSETICTSTCCGLVAIKLQSLPRSKRRFETETL